MLRLYVLLLFLEVTADSRCPSNSVFNEDLDKCLLLNPPSLTFEGACSVCSRYRGQLAFPRNFRESRILSEAVRRLLPTTKEIWIDRPDVGANIEEQENFDPLFDCVVISLQSQSLRYTSCYMTYSSVCYLPHGRQNHHKGNNPSNQVLKPPRNRPTTLTPPKETEEDKKDSQEVSAPPVVPPPPCPPLPTEEEDETTTTLSTTPTLPTEPATTTKCDTSCECPGRSTHFKGRCFYLSPPKDHTWEDAQQYCQNAGGHLPIVDPREIGWVVNSLVEPNEVWIGLSVDVNDGFKWKWADNTPADGLEPANETDMNRCQHLKYTEDPTDKSGPKNVARIAVECDYVMPIVLCEKPIGNVKKS